MSEAEARRKEQLARVRAGLPAEKGDPAALAAGIQAAQATARARAREALASQEPDAEPVEDGEPGTLAGAKAAERAADASEARAVAAALPEPTQPEDMDLDTLADDLAAEAAADLLGPDMLIEGDQPKGRLDYRKLSDALIRVLLEAAPDYFTAKMALTVAQRVLGQKWARNEREKREAARHAAEYRAMLDAASRKAAN